MSLADLPVPTPGPAIIPQIFDLLRPGEVGPCQRNIVTKFGARPNPNFDEAKCRARGGTPKGPDRTGAQPVPPPPPTSSGGFIGGDIVDVSVPPVPGRVGGGGFNPNTGVVSSPPRVVTTSTPNPFPQRAPTAPGRGQPVRIYDLQRELDALKRAVARELETGGARGARARTVLSNAGRVLARAGGVLGGVLYPSEISPSDLPRPVGPPRRGGARRPVGQGTTQAPTALPGGAPVGAARSPVAAPPRPVRPSPGPVPTFPAPPAPVVTAPRVSFPTPTVPKSSAGPLGAIGDLLKRLGAQVRAQFPRFLLDQVFAPRGGRGRTPSRSTSLNVGSSRVPGSGFTDPLTPPRTGALSSAQPQPQPQPGGGRCPPCRSQRRKRKKSKPRTVCYSGTYTEKARGLTKRKRRKVPCK